MDRNEIRIRANQAIADLGPERVDPDLHDHWVQERGQAVMLLAYAANRSPQVLRDAAIGAWVYPATRGLLLDAVHECQ